MRESSVALFRFTPVAEPSPYIVGKGIYLRPAEMSDYPEWADLRERSRSFLQPWEPVWPADDLTKAAFKRRLRRHAEELAGDESYPLLLFRQDDRALIGGLTLGQIRRGVAQSGTLGYWMGAPYAGRGYMTRAVRAIVGFGFGTLRLHRIEAACLPHNSVSKSLLEKAGFRHEGLAKAYLRINGAWQDHLLFALIENDDAALRLLRE
jgi:ribosomal-protein-alanine N-acetyltransferase